MANENVKQYNFPNLYNRPYKYESNDELEFETDDIRSRSIMRSTNPFKNDQQQEFADESMVSKFRDSQNATDPTYIAQFNDSKIYFASGPAESNAGASSYPEYNDELREFFKKKIVKVYNVYRDHIRFGDPAHTASKNLSNAEKIILK